MMMMTMKPLFCTVLQLLFLSTFMPCSTWGQTDNYAWTIQLRREQPHRVYHCALGLLSSTINWNTQDDRDCFYDRYYSKYSCFCALRLCQEYWTDGYLHRGIVMTAMRRAIYEKYPVGSFAHPIQDYNNLDDMTLEELKDTMLLAMDIIPSPYYS